MKVGICLQIETALQHLEQVFTYVALECKTTFLTETWERVEKVGFYVPCVWRLWFIVYSLMYVYLTVTVSTKGDGRMKCSEGWLHSTTNTSVIVFVVCVVGKVWLFQLDVIDGMALLSSCLSKMM